MTIKKKIPRSTKLNRETLLLSALLVSKMSLETRYQELLFNATKLESE
jgi:hypothetical protein